MLLNGNSQTVFSSGTANQGTGPCQLVVSGAGGGGFAIIDTLNATLYTQGAYSPPGTVSGTLPANATLTQVSLSVEGLCMLSWQTLSMECTNQRNCVPGCSGLETVLMGRDRLPHPPTGWYGLQRHVACSGTLRGSSCSYAKSG